MKKEIAKHLLDIGAVALKPEEPFTWSSGIKSPIYCDNRLILSYPLLRKKVAKAIEEVIIGEYPQAEVIAGTATAGIPHAAWVSDRLNLPMCYVRSKAKGHGKGNQIEGAIRAGQKVVVIEDLISTGGSVLTAVDALRNAGCEVLGVVGIFSYELAKGIENLEEATVNATTLSDYTTLIEVAKEAGIITDLELKKLEKWRENPEDESWLLAE